MTHNPTDDDAGLVRRLRKSKMVNKLPIIHDGQLMTTAVAVTDPDCVEAAARIEALVAEAERLRRDRADLHRRAQKAEGAFWRVVVALNLNGSKC